MRPAFDRPAGVLLILGSGLLLLCELGFATLAAGGLPNDSPEWWPTVLKTMVAAPNGQTTLILLASFSLGAYLCVRTPDRPWSARRITIWAIAGVTFLGILLWSSTREYVVLVGRHRATDGSTTETVHDQDGFGRIGEVQTVKPAP